MSKYVKVESGVVTTTQANCPVMPNPARDTQTPPYDVDTPEFIDNPAYDSNVQGSAKYIVNPVFIVEYVTDTAYTLETNDAIEAGWTWNATDGFEAPTQSDNDANWENANTELIEGRLKCSNERWQRRLRAGDKRGMSTQDWTDLDNFTDYTNDQLTDWEWGLGEYVAGDLDGTVRWHRCIIANRIDCMASGDWTALNTAAP